MFRQACLAGISPLDFDRMELWQVCAAVDGFDGRMKLQARIGDALAYKVIRGCSLDKPRFVAFDKLFPQWREEEPPKKLPKKPPGDAARDNRRRLDEWCDIFED